MGKEQLELPVILEHHSTDTDVFNTQCKIQNKCCNFDIVFKGETIVFRVQMQKGAF